MADDDCQIIFAKCKLWPTKVKKDEDEWMIEDMARVNLLDTTISVRSLDVGPKKQEDADSMILEDGELASAADRSLPPSDDEIIVVKKTTKDVRTRDRHRQSASERKIAHTASRTISKQSRKERDHQKPVLLQLAIRVKNQLFSSGTSFLAVQKLVETIFAKRRDSTRDLERLMKLSNDKFMRRIHSYLIDFNWKRLDPTLVEEVLGAMTRRAKLVKNNKSLVKPMLEAESSILPFSFIQFSGPSQILRLDRIKIIADGEVMDPLAVAWDGREFLFAGKDKLFSCDEKGDGLKLLYCTNSQPTALAVVCPGEVVAFVQGSTIKFYYKLEKKVETHITELRGPRGLAYIRGVLITLEYIDGCYWIRAYSAYTKQMIGRQRYGYGKPSFVTSSAGRLYITDLRNKTVQIVAVSVSSNNSQAVFKTIMTTKLGKEELKEDNTIFPAGIAADSRGEIIVSDARHGAENCVLWFNAQMSQWSRVEIAPGAYPYGSQIAISPNGYFLVACRQSHGMALFQFVR